MFTTKDFISSHLIGHAAFGGEELWLDLVLADQIADIVVQKEIETSYPVN